MRSCSRCVTREVGSLRSVVRCGLCVRLCGLLRTINHVWPQAELPEPGLKRIRFVYKYEQ